MKLTKEKIKKFIDDFETNPITVKWIESVENRGKFQREMDKEFFKLTRNTINKLIDLIVFMNTIYGSVEKINTSIQSEQEKYLRIVEDLEEQLKRLTEIKNGNKS